MRIIEIGNYAKRRAVKNVIKMEILKSSCACSHEHHDIQETKTKIVVFISVLTMVTEILFGYITNSMALLSDGWHMASHVLAMGLTWFAYVCFRRNQSNQKFKNGTGKILSLLGYISGILLMLMAVWMAFECVSRIFTYEIILYHDAIMVAIIGLIVNLVCAFILQSKHHHEDDNIKAAYTHVLTDALTSFFAIVALYMGKKLNLVRCRWWNDWFCCNSKMVIRFNKTIGDKTTRL